VLGPALDELDQLVDMLNENKKNLQDTITGLRGYTTAVGEALASGPWFDIYLQNLTSPATLAPILSGVSQ
jgi:phospholipid/cholesterol/gamma-HCH transport system substrate-binding protein